MKDVVYGILNDYKFHITMKWIKNMALEYFQHCGFGEFIIMYECD